MRFLQTFAYSSGANFPILVHTTRCLAAPDLYFPLGRQSVEGAPGNMQDYRYDGQLKKPVGVV